jgi:hypothetical protein
MTGRPEPDQVIEPRSPEGTGVGVVWRLTRVR